MSVREIVTIGHPALRQPARRLALERLHSPEVQALIDDLIETRRAANGAGIAANQIGESLRIAIAEVDGSNPRYPYKPPIPLTVFVNPEIEPLGSETLEINEGCLSVPDLRGVVERHAEVRIHYLDREGNEREEVKRGLTAGTFQHEVDHLDGTLIVDRADPRTLMTWEHYERLHRDEFERQAKEIVERFGQ